MVLGGREDESRRSRSDGEKVLKGRLFYWKGRLHLTAGEWERKS